MRRHGAGRWLHLGLVLGLSLGIAGFVQTIADRHSVRFDLTPRRRLSLAESTKRVLERLPGRIDVTVYYRREDFQQIADLMDLFRGAAPNFRARLLQLDRHPGLARRDGVDRYGQAVIRYGERSIAVDASHEQTIAGGLLRLLRGRPTRIAFLEGHGEPDLADVTSPGGYGELLQALRQGGYDLAGLNLLTREEGPADPDLVVVAGPKSDLLEKEVAALDRYLARGGHVLALLDPVPLPNLERFVRANGIDVSLDVVRDTENPVMGSDPFTVAVPTFRGHPVTGTQAPPALLAVARMVAAGRRSGAVISTVAETYPQAWAMRDFKRAGDPESVPRPGEDRPGPVPVMAAASWPVGEEGEARLVVVGDSDFAANGFLNLLGNRDLVLNAIAWGVSTEPIVASHPGTEIEALRPLSPLVLVGTQGRWIFLVTVILVPALVLAAGSAVALRRRWYG